MPKPNDEVPGFLRNVPAETDENNKENPVDDTPNPLADPIEETPVEENKDEKTPESGDTPNADENKPEDKGDAGKGDKKPEGEENKDDKGDPNDPNKSDKKDEKPGDNKPDDQKPDKKDDKKPEDKNNTPPADKAEKSEVDKLKEQVQNLQKSLEEATKKVTKPEDQPDPNKPKEPTEFEKQLKAFETTPVITANQPTIDKYKLDDDSYDIDAYMNDRERNLILGIQKALLGGPLAAAQFQILSQAIGETNTKAVEEKTREEYVTNTWTKLQGDFPRLKDDEKLQNLFASEINAEKQRRFEEAGKDPSKYVDLAYDDYKKLLTDLLAYVSPQKETVQTQDPVEQVHGTPVIETDKAPTDPVMKDIEDMKRAKQSTSFF